MDREQRKFRPELTELKIKGRKEGEQREKWMEVSKFTSGARTGGREGGEEGGLVVNRDPFSIKSCGR